MREYISAVLKLNFIIPVLAVIMFNVLPVSAQEVDDCLSCHDDTTLTTKVADGTERSLYVDKEMYLKSTHGEMEYDCTDCHDGPTLAEHKDGKKYDKISCGDCHDDASAKHEKTSHGQLAKEGNANAPTCMNCHTSHAVLRSDNPESTVNSGNLAKTCGECHAAEASPGLIDQVKGFVQGKKDIPNPGIVQIVLSAIPTRVKGHGKVNVSCDFDTQKCSNCHFNVVNHGDEELKPQVCAKCHNLDKNKLFFGTIHKSGFAQSPLMIILSILSYLVVIGLAVKCLLAFCPKKKKKEEQSE
jgi:ribosomal protein S27AE